MKKFVVIGLICLMGCTSVDTYKCKRDLENYKIKTDGNLNGFAINDNEIIEGRTHGANYKRLLIYSRKGIFMTKHAYDCGRTKDDKNTMLYIWFMGDMNTLYYELRDLRALCRDKIYSPIYCYKLEVKDSSIKLFNKAEADAYLKEHPKTEIFKSA